MYKKKTESNGSSFFQDRIKFVMRKLYERWEEANEREYWWSIPPVVKAVRVVTKE